MWFEVYTQGCATLNTVTLCGPTERPSTRSQSLHDSDPLASGRLMPAFCPLGVACLGIVV